MSEAVSKSVDASEFVINFSVVTTDVSATNALTNNNIVSKRVVDSLGRLNINSEMLTTVSFNVGPSYQSVLQDNIYINKLIGFQATNNLSVKITKDIKTVGLAIDAIVLAGGVINFIDFKVDDKSIEAIKMDLIKEAAGNAIKKANYTSGLFNLKVIDVLSIAVDPVSPVYSYYAADARAAGVSSSPQIFNSNSYTVYLNLQVTFIVAKRNN